MYLVLKRVAEQVYVPTESFEGKPCVYSTFDKATEYVEIHTKENIELIVIQISHTSWRYVMGNWIENEVSL